MEEKKFKFDISSAFLHIFAMLTMLCDHTWAVLLPQYEILTCIGRVTFPIFAFMIVEGYFHTKNLKKYLGRMLIFAIISEIPFDLVYSNAVIYPHHQNVMWTFLISLLIITLVEYVKKKDKLWLTILALIGGVLGGYIIGIAINPDYYGSGIVTIMVFYIFRGKKWWCYLGQFACLYYLNVEILGGYCYIINLFGHKIEFVQQSLALLALIPIWLYRGRQGYHKKWFQYFCYAFYPVHLAALYIIYRILY